MKNSNWVEALQETLSKNAYAHFGDKPPAYPDFKEYISELTTVKDWDDTFLDSTYHLLLEKIHKAGKDLENKVK